MHHGHTHALVELAEELAADSEHLSEDESVLARAEREAAADDDADGHVGAGRGVPTAGPRTPAPAG